MVYIYIMGKYSGSRLESIHSFTVMPKDCNFNLDKSTNRNRILFGGTILFNLDFAAAKIARRATYGVKDMDMVVTASVGQTNFERPAFVGDIITYTSTIKALGKSSIQIRIKVVRESIKGVVEDICSSNMTFVTMMKGKPIAHHLTFDKLGDN